MTTTITLAAAVKLQTLDFHSPSCLSGLLLLLLFFIFHLRTLKIQLFKCWMYLWCGVAKQQILEPHLMITHAHSQVKWLCKYPCFTAEKKVIDMDGTCNKIYIGYLVYGMAWHTISYEYDQWRFSKSSNYLSHSLSLSLSDKIKDDKKGGHKRNEERKRRENPVANGL